MTRKEPDLCLKTLRHAANELMREYRLVRDSPNDYRCGWADAHGCLATEFRNQARRIERRRKAKK